VRELAGERVRLQSMNFPFGARAVRRVLAFRGGASCQAMGSGIPIPKYDASALRYASRKWVLRTVPHFLLAMLSANYSNRPQKWATYYEVMKNYGEEK